MQNIGKFPLKAWQSQLIQNQATSLFVLTLPDRLGLTSIFEHAADAHSEEVRAEIAGRAFKVRKAGTDLISLAGGRASLHNIWGRF